MSLLLGVCTSTEGTDRQADLRDLGAPIARFVLTASDDTRRRLPAWHTRLGRKAHGVVARETFLTLGLDPYRDFDACAVAVRDRWGTDLWAIEPGNEPDDSGGSSYAMTPEQFSALLWAFCRTFHVGQHDTPVLISGGLNTGQPPYAWRVSFPACVWFGLHSYDKSLDGWPAPNWGWGDLDDYLEAYRGIWSQLRGVALTEWGHTSQDGAFGAEYVRRFLELVRCRPEVELAEFFCLNDWQHRPHGLVLDDGTRRPQFDAYAQEIRRQPPTRDRRAFMFAGAAGRR